MKKILVLTALCLVFSWAHIAAQTSGQSDGIEISFTFNRQGGFASNQFAVWVEDSGGRLVKTLYATKFTADGGWERREESIPLWVRKSGLANLKKPEIDAFTGATPRTGAQTYRWDGRDKNGLPVSPGEYRVCLEGSLRSENRVLYSAAVTVGSGTSGTPAEAEVKPVYFGSGTKERGMIENVKVSYRR